MPFELWPRARAPGRAKETLVHADALYNLARYLTRDPSDAEDLVQETYERALRAWDQLERDTNVKAWLFRILRNAFISRYRQEQRRPALELYDTTEQAPEAAIDDGSGSTPGGAEPEQLRRLVSREHRGGAPDVVRGRSNRHPARPGRLHGERGRPRRRLCGGDGQVTVEPGARSAPAEARGLRKTG